MARKYVNPVIEDFYRHLLSFEETRSFFKDPKVLERVKGLQKTYFLGLTEGDYGARGRGRTRTRVRAGLVGGSPRSRCARHGRLASPGRRRAPVDVADARGCGSLSGSPILQRDAVAVRDDAASLPGQRQAARTRRDRWPGDR